MLDITINPQPLEGTVEEEVIVQPEQKESIIQNKKQEVEQVKPSVISNKTNLKQTQKVISDHSKSKEYIDFLKEIQFYFELSYMWDS